MVVLSKHSLSPHTNKNDFKYDRIADALKRDISDDKVSRCPEVRFQTDQKSIINPLLESFDEEEVESRWYSSKDLLQYRRNSKFVASALRKDAKQVGNVCLAHLKTALVVAAEFQQLVKLSRSSPDEDQLCWCFHNDGRRGLERLPSKEYAGRRRGDIHSVIKAVKDEQLRQREKNIQDPTSIAFASRNLTRRSRSFAAYMGGADQRALGKNYEDDADQKFCIFVNVVARLAKG
jgi:hypothetical protein